METPNTPALADLNYPSAIKKLQKEVDRLFVMWVEEDSRLLELQDDLETALLKDAKALREAAIAGTPDPGDINSDKLRRAIRYQEERARYAKTQVERAGRELKALVISEKQAVIALAVEKARIGIEKWREDLKNISRLQTEASDSRSRSLDGLRMIGYWGLVKERFQFDPNFPVDGNYSLPNSSELNLIKILDLLSEFISNKAMAEAPSGEN